MEKKEEILRVRNLDISFETTAGVSMLSGASPDGKPGRDRVAIVGESMFR